MTDPGDDETPVAAAAASPANEGAPGVTNGERRNSTTRERRDSFGMAGMNLYGVLNLEKDATEDDIKRAYRRMALKYHPDKNPDNEEAADKFKEINYANTVLSNPTKRRIYDSYGAAGLKMSETLGEENLGAFLLAKNPWFKCCLIFTFCCTGCCCCLCCCCCFNFCCGKFKPKPEEGEEEFFAWVDPEQASGSGRPGGTDATEPVTTQPMSQSGSPGAERQRGNNPEPADRPTVIAMPYPAPPSYDDVIASEPASKSAVPDASATVTSMDSPSVVTSQPTSISPSAAGDSPSERSPLTKEDKQTTATRHRENSRGYGSTTEQGSD